MADYKFYIQKVNKSGVTETRRDMESYFSGLRYRRCEGLEAKGKPKNIYTEDYAEQSGLRVYHPADNTGGAVTFGETRVKLDLVFVGSSRRDGYRNFVNFVNSSRVYYWDTARLSKALLVLNEASEPKEDVLKGVPYIEAEFTFTNVWGEGKPCNASGTLV